MSVMMRPQQKMMAVKKIRGVRRLRSALVSGSKIAYEMKKIVREMLYCIPV